MIIPNFPAELLQEHHAWHNGARNPPPMTPGAGINFLDFHRDFVAMVLGWYSTQPGFDSSTVAPWTVIPGELKRSTLNWNVGLATDEQRLANDPASFSSLDEMGRFIEFGEFGGNNIHGWMHNAAATQFGESVLQTLDSPLSTYFYQLHGLIENWRLARQQAVPRVEVPDLLSHTASRAVKIAHALLLNKGLRFRDVGALQITDSSGQSLPGHVTAQDPRGGAMVERGTEVVLQIGDYHADPITSLGHAHP